jgi:zinc transporter, ZIP family
MNGTVEMAFLLTILAGLSTGIGSLIAMLLKDNKNTNYLTFSMSFAAGVMLFVSFVEILPHATHELEEIYGKEGHEHFGAILATICFFGGIFLVALIDKLIPKGESPHEFISQKDMESGVESPVNKKKLMRVGTLAAVALALHNFPEGIATFTAALNDVQMGATIAVAIALHNIPEGIAVSMPIYYATGSRKKAFFLLLPFGHRRAARRVFGLRYFRLVYDG